MLASFPGPAQLFVVMQATESWAGAGNEASHMQGMDKLRVRVRVRVDSSSSCPGAHCKEQSC